MGTDSDDGTSASSTAALALIEEQAEERIRRVWHNGRWFFSVIDVIGLLTDSANPGVYWRVLKSRLVAEGSSETVTKCNRLKMLAADGKMRDTDAADTETLLRIIQEVPSPKAEPVKRWLAKVGAQRLEDVSRPPLAPAEASTAIATIPKPAIDAPALQWAQYHEQLAALYRRQALYEQHLATVEAQLTAHDTQLAEHEQQIAGLHDRMESVEALAGQVLPDLLERLAEMGPQTLTPEHQATVKAMVGRLHDIGGYAFATIYSDLNAAFHVGKYSDIPDAQWTQVAEWLQRRIDAASQRRSRPSLN